MAFKFCELDRIATVTFPYDSTIGPRPKTPFWNTPDFSLLKSYPDPIHFDENMVNSYFELAQRTPTSFGCKFLFLPRQFLMQLFREEYTHQKIIKMDDNIFAYNLFMVPVYINSIRQWCLFKVDLRKQIVQFYDPSSQINSYEVYCNKLIEFVNFEAERLKHRRGNWFPKPEKLKWKIQKMDDWKQQECTEDSGLLVCVYAETILGEHLPFFNLLSFAQFRAKIFFEIARKDCLSITWYSAFKKQLQLLENGKSELKHNKSVQLPSVPPKNLEPIKKKMPKLDDPNYIPKSRACRMVLKCRKRREEKNRQLQL